MRRKKKQFGLCKFLSRASKEDQKKEKEITEQSAISDFYDLAERFQKYIISEPQNSTTKKMENRHQN